MLKRILGISLSALIMLSVLSGCGAKSSKSPQNAAVFKGSAQRTEAAGQAGSASAQLADYAGNVKADQASKPGVAEKPTAAVAPAAPAPAGGTGLTGSGLSGQSVANAILAQRKIIRNANVIIEVEDFSIAYSKINTFINGIGFIQETNIKKDKVYVDGEMKLITGGTIIIRVDKDKFDQVMSDISGIGLLLDQQIKTDDVTDKYFDVESRLRLLRFEEARLEEYLKKLTDPDTIFKTESRLTDIRQEIEGLTGTLRKLSDLTELSTITINLNEKNPAKQLPPQPKTYGQKLLGNFLDSIKGVTVFCGELLILIVQAIPVLILLGLFALVVLALYRKVGKSVKPQNGKKDNDSPM